ncbi:hypothetical protein [Pandoraea oxalativorans]|uniref:hypothetical protein n=1 Tax=Pandoraea oxalativorans TaxID=573737 RepID=UPI000A80D26D|nr:hypothetical protein [Pandoraea oxalativorans]
MRARQYEQGATAYKRGGWMGMARSVYRQLADGHLDAGRYEQAEEAGKLAKGDGVR